MKTKTLIGIAAVAGAGYLLYSWNVRRIQKAYTKAIEDRKQNLAKGIATGAKCKRMSGTKCLEYNV